MIHLAHIECIAAVLVALVATVIELRTGEIPNWLTLGTLLVGPMMGLIDRRLVDHFGGLAIAALPTIIAYRNDLVGGGTVKLMWAVGALIGIRGAVLLVALVAVVYGGTWVYAHFKKRFLEVPSSPLVLAAIVVSVGLGVLGVPGGTPW